ncbi:hypothetical protein IJ843_08925 [bacterium]|nr:hypothetical protein [bacterium]
MAQLELPYVADEALTGLAIAYKPSELIADELLTKTYVDSPEFKYHYYDKGQFLTTGDTEIGEYGEPDETEYKYTEKHNGTGIYAHMTKLSVRHLEMTTQEKDKEAKRVMFSKNHLKLAGETRLAKMLRNADNYEGNAVTLTSANDFNSENAKPIQFVQECADKMFKKPNTMIISRAGASFLRSCPSVVQMYKGNAIQDGLVPVEFLKECFDVENILIGGGRINTNKKGQALALSYVWGNDMVLAYIDPAADLDCGVTFGQRVVYKDYNVQTFLDAKPGAAGVKYYKSVEEYKDLITCPDCGYLIKRFFAA